MFKNVGTQYFNYYLLRQLALKVNFEPPIKTLILILNSIPVSDNFFCSFYVETLFNTKTTKKMFFFGENIITFLSHLIF